MQLEHGQKIGALLVNFFSFSAFLNYSALGLFSETAGIHRKTPKIHCIHDQLFAYYGIGHAFPSRIFIDFQPFSGAQKVNFFTSR